MVKAFQDDYQSCSQACDLHTHASSTKMLGLGMLIDRNQITMQEEEKLIKPFQNLSHLFAAGSDDFADMQMQ